MENLPAYGRTPSLHHLPTPTTPPGVPEGLHRRAHWFAMQAYFQTFDSVVFHELELNYQNEVLLQQLHMHNLYNAPEVQVDETVDETIDETTCLQDKTEFMECLKEKNASIHFQQALKSSSATKDRIVELFDSLDINEIVSLSKDINGNYFMSKAIKYVGGDPIERFMEKLIRRPESIQQISTGAKSPSYKVIISLILTGKSLKNYDEFINILKGMEHINPYIIQQAVKHIPEYKTFLLEGMKRGEFPYEALSLCHLCFLGMYSQEEIRQLLMTSDKVTEKLRKYIQTRNWDTIQQKSIAGSEPRFLSQD